MPDTTSSAKTRRKDNPNAQRILEAARKIFTRCGYNTACMDDIAAEAGVSKSTVYAHFDSKKQLFASMMNQESQNFLTLLEIPERVEEKPLREELLRIAGNYTEVILTPRKLSLYRIAIAESRHFPELGGIFYESGPKSKLDGLARYLDSALRRGEIETNDTRLAADQFFSMLRGDLHLRILLSIETPSRESAQEAHYVAKRTVDTFLRAYATTGESGSSDR